MTINHKRDIIESFVTKKDGKRVLQKILIANNGMAAIKFMKSIRDWCEVTFNDDRMIEFVVMASTNDMEANAEFIQYADYVREVPGGPNYYNYANVSLICTIAVEYKVDAVWPGWGHASENPDLPNTLDTLGIKFIGPPGKPMYALGDKIGSTLIAQSSGVSTISWSGDGLKVEYKALGYLPPDIYKQATVSTAEEAMEVIQRIGYPVMIKASEGGGGKGIRRVDHPSMTETAFRQVQSEIPGSPIFIMRLSDASRHLEIQLLGDEYNQVIALSGRDCSIQRRHQKIIEEGPPLHVPENTWKQMERSAIALAMEVNYQNAGTVEFLYNTRNEFFFLELNPRLQVEHPVTEMITNVNLPACQLQVAMGIPLHRMDDIRTLYGFPTTTSDKIDFLSEYEEDVHTVQKNVRGHCVAARITAEDPERSFAPSSGKVEEICFRPLRNVWGYFSIRSNGKIHDYADSQFGHIFSFGVTREEAVKNLKRALSDLIIRGEIYTTIPYLKRLLEHERHVNYLFDTTWLDKQLKEKTIQVHKLHPNYVVLLGALCRAYVSHSKKQKELLSTLSRGHTVNPSTIQWQDKVTLIYEQKKYMFHVTPLSETEFEITCNGSKNKAILHEYKSSLSISVHHKQYLCSVHDEDINKLTINRVLYQFTDEVDPSKLYSASGGKLVRYLVKDNHLITKGQPYAEIEVMKMNMPLVSTESGNIHLIKSEGSILKPGELIATLDIQNQSFQTIPLYDGVFVIDTTHETVLTIFDQFKQSQNILQNVLNGYEDVSWKQALYVIDKYGKSIELVKQDIQYQLSNQRKFLPESVTKEIQCIVDYQQTVESLVGDIHKLTDRIYLEPYKMGMNHYFQSIYDNIRKEFEVHENDISQAIRMNEDLVTGLKCIYQNNMQRVVDTIRKMNCVERKHLYTWLYSDKSNPQPLTRNEQLLDPIRERARLCGTTYCYDFIPMFKSLVEMKCDEIVNREDYQRLNETLFLTKREFGKNDIAMVAFLMQTNTKPFILVMNDITKSSGSFGTKEDIFFAQVAKYARMNKYPLVYIASNSGARIGISEELKTRYKIKWTEEGNKIEYLYLTDSDYEIFKPYVHAEKVEVGYRLKSIIGKEPDLGVENLSGSGLIAGEMARAYNETYTISFVTGRTVGIGSYLVRLGRRVIQKQQDASIILTGYQALNSVIGKDVYVSNYQLGGVDVMYKNGVTTSIVNTDLQGVMEICKNLAYLPSFDQMFQFPTDSVMRKIDIHPNHFGGKIYDPRLLLTGANEKNGFFDQHSFYETNAGWAKSVITGRAKLGGIPIGCIIPELRTTTTIIPPDPVNINDSERINQQSGQVWYPDSSYKTAQCIEDCKRENIPLIIFANWRGFSGGQRDMFDEILKYGSMIVDALVDYKKPIFVYLGPGSELRGGAWVVIDSMINKKVMEMYADPSARGGVLEPIGTASIKYREKDLLETAYKNDEQLQQMMFQKEDPVKIKERESQLLPLIQQAAIQFVDMHDMPERMKAKNVIRDIIPWEQSRIFFHRRLRELEYI